MVNPRRIALITALAVALAPVAASAQFTTFIAPPSKAKDSVKAAVVAVQKATQDSVVRAQISDMKTWVDSAAGILPTRPVLDTALVFDSATGTVVAAPVVVPAFVNGARAPATATPLPAFVAIGALLMFLGLWMVRPRRARSAVGKS
jgi:hypothetical protein